MGYKILDVKADIHEDVEKYLSSKSIWLDLDLIEERELKEGILDIVDKHFEKIER